MAHVFLSYSQNDRFFAELLQSRLENEGIHVWVDRGRLRAGDDWRNGIDRGISECFAVLLALSVDSTASAYVTYEWASAMGKGKPIIPIRLDDCQMHPKLEVIQHLDFSTKNLPWSMLVERVREVEQERESPEFELQAASAPVADEESGSGGDRATDPVVKSVLAYMNERGYQMVSFERIRRRIDEGLTDEKLQDLIGQHRDILRRATLKGGRPGMAKL